MSGRPATPIGEHGKLSFSEHRASSGRKILAMTYVRDADGVSRRVKASGRTQTIAQNALLAKLAKRGARVAAAKVRANMTVPQLADLYAASLEANTNLKAQTKTRYEQSARGAISRAFHMVTVVELSPGMVERFITGLAQRDRVSEARNCRVVLRAMMRMAVADDVIKQNPVANADIRLPTSIKSARALTLDELVRLRDLVAAYRTGPGVMGPRQSPALMEALDVMLGTGARISEVLAIRTEDVTFFEDGRAEVLICGTIIFKNGVGAIRQETTKNRRSRPVTVATWVTDILRTRSVATRSGFLWETPRTAKPYQQQNLLRDLRSIVAGTDLAWVTSHALRKTAGTMIAKNLGVSAATTALGHSSDAVTRRIYLDEQQLTTDISTALNDLAPRP
jgi:integrase